jgi:hypothetical protein
VAAILVLTLSGLAVQRWRLAILLACTAELPFTGGASRVSVRRAAAVLALFAGAVAGALLLKTGLWLPLAAAAGLGLATWLTYVSAMRRHP